MTLTYERDKLLSDLRTSVVRVTFNKINGEERIMRCTLDQRAIPVPMNYDYLEEEHKKPEREDVLVVWDLDKGGWRSFHISLVKYVEEIDGF